MLNNKLILIFIYITVVSLFTSPLFGQSHENSESNEHEFKKIGIAVNMGQAYISGASFGIENNFVVIPVLGFDIQYKFNTKWGVTVKSDMEIAKYTITNSEHASDIERTNPFIVSMAVLYSPWDNGFSFLLGPGIELEDEENFSIFRLGVRYDFEFGNEWEFTPELVYDLKDGNINSITLALGVGKKF